LLRGGLKFKSKPLTSSSTESDNFNYHEDFNYLMMRDKQKERDTFFLDTNQNLQISDNDCIFFENKLFFIKTAGEHQIIVTNDALGKNIILRDHETTFPLHIGDRVEFEQGMRLILRGFYTRVPESQEKPQKPLALYFEQERTIIPLEEPKTYIVGRNTSDIRNLPFDEDIFCFINIGRRERSISRQNFQIFFHDAKWYIQDLGSRYGTTLEFSNHVKMETLTGGSIMPLEEGLIRLGYDKSYIIHVNDAEKLETIKQKKLTTIPASNKNISIYDLTLL
jgi:hypothetical protein